MKNEMNRYWPKVSFSVMQNLLAPGLSAQTLNQNPLPADTSFSPYQACIKIKKDFGSLINILDTFGIYSEVHTLDGPPHTFWLFDLLFEPTVEYMVNFWLRFLKIRKIINCS